MSFSCFKALKLSWKKKVILNYHPKKTHTRELWMLTVSSSYTELTLVIVVTELMVYFNWEKHEGQRVSSSSLWSDPTLPYNKYSAYKLSA